MWKQVKDFNRAKAGTKAGMCLQNVRLGYSIPGKYDSAWEAWKHTQQHGNRILPKGVDVPLFYDYTDKSGNRYGHINVRLADGRVWNDGKIFASLASFTQAWGNVKYVGWGESVNDVRVIKEVQETEDMYKGHSAKYWYEQFVQQQKVSEHHQTKRRGLINKLKDLVRVK